jgi:hypothetical protein
MKYYIDKLLIFVIIGTLFFVSCRPANQLAKEKIKEKLHILNNSLFIDDNEIAELREKERVSYYDLGDLYLIQIESYNLREEYSFLYDKQKNQKINLEFYADNHEVYFWNSILIYRIKKKAGGSVLYDTINQKQTILHEWIGGFYIINDELCILTLTDYKSITSGKEYKRNMTSDMTSNKLTALEKKEVELQPLVGK